MGSLRGREQLGTSSSHGQVNVWDASWGLSVVDRYCFTCSGVVCWVLQMRLHLEHLSGHLSKGRMTQCVGPSRVTNHRDDRRDRCRTGEGRGYSLSLTFTLLLVLVLVLGPH